MTDVLSREQIEARKKIAEESLLFWRGSDSYQAEDAIGYVEEDIALCDMALSALDNAEDAERYRWLRDGGKEYAELIQPVIMCGDDMLADDLLDAAIDAARKEATK